MLTLNRSRQLFVGRTRKAWRFSWPCILTYVILSLRSVADIYFLGQVGVTDLAAYATGHIFLFLFLSFGVGYLFSVNSEVSRAIGKGEVSLCGRIVWQGIYFSVIYGVGVLVFYQAAPVVFPYFGHEAVVTGKEISYFQTAIPSAVFQMVAWTVMNFLFGANRPKTVLWIACLTLVLHVGVGRILILDGWKNLPNGITGAGWALVFSSIFHAVVSLCLFLTLPAFKKFRPGRFGPRWGLFWRQVKNGVPIGMREVLDSFIWNFVVIWIIGSFGTVSLAAATILLSIEEVLILPLDGLGTASVAFIANALGKRRIQLADKWRRHIWIMMNGYAVVAGLLFYVFRHDIISWFASAEDGEAAQALAVSLAFFIPMIMLCYATYSAYDHALCATDDNSWPSWITFLSSAVLLGGGGWILLTHFREAGSYGAWALVTANIAIVATAFFFRWEKGVWKPKMVF